MVSLISFCSDDMDYSSTSLEKEKVKPKETGKGSSYFILFGFYRFFRTVNGGAMLPRIRGRLCNTLRERRRFYRVRY